MKLNKKGFMMAEVVVVSAVILIFLTALFISYNKIYIKYKSRVAYYDTVALYRLAYYRDILIENERYIIDLFDISKCNDYAVLKVKKENDSISVLELKKGNDGVEKSILEEDHSCEDEKEDQGAQITFKLDNDGESMNGITDNVYFIYTANSNLVGTELDKVKDAHKTLKEYVRFLSTAVDFSKTPYVMILERCNVYDNDKRRSNNSCKYAYLDIYESCDDC